MTSYSLRRQMRSLPFGVGIIALWREYIRRRQHRRQMAGLENLNDFRRRDLGLASRGAPVRHVYFTW